MSKLTSEVVVKLDALEKAIRADLTEASKEVGLVRDHMKAALVAAWCVGKSLLEAKEKAGHGHFMTWCERFNTDHKTLTRYMLIASNWATMSNLPANKREAYLLLGVLPDKEEIQHDGNITFPTPGVQHQRFLNRFMQWKNEVQSGKLAINTEQVKIDLRELYDWLKGFYGE